MFSGKTEELIRRIRRAQIARQKVIIFKPRIDSRFSKDHIVSHSEQSFISTLVDDASEIPALAADAQVIGIDEGQFFKENLVSICEELADAGKRVIVAGLDQDFRWPAIRANAATSCCRRVHYKNACNLCRLWKPG